MDDDPRQQRWRAIIRGTLVTMMVLFVGFAIEELVLGSLPWWGWIILALVMLVGLIVNETWPWKKAARGSWRKAHANLWTGLKPTFDKELAVIMIYVFTLLRVCEGGGVLGVGNRLGVSVSPPSADNLDLDAHVTVKRLWLRVVVEPAAAVHREAHTDRQHPAGERLAGELGTRYQC